MTAELDAPEQDQALDAALRLQIAETEGQIQRADGKASHLLAAHGLPLTVIVAVSMGRHLPFLAGVLMGTAAFCIGTAMVLVVNVVLPRMRDASPGSYLFHATATPAEVRQDVLRPRDQSERLIALSRIARRKYRMVAVACYATIVAVTLLVLALLAAW